MMRGSDICGTDIIGLHQPPWRARTISTLSPGLSAVAGHAARGTTAPLSATAMPRWAVSAVFSASSASRVFGAANGSLSPLTRISACAIACSPLLGRPRRQKTFETERPDRGLHDIVEDEPRHGV